MRSVWVGAIGLCLAAGCLASRQGDPQSEVDTIYDLEAEIDALVCGCRDGQVTECDGLDISDEMRACLQRVVNAHRADFEPLIECTLQELEQERDCLMTATCGSDAWFACRERDEHCDDSPAERHESELQPCIEDAMRGSDGASDDMVLPNPSCGDGLLEQGEECEVIDGIPVFRDGISTCGQATMGAMPSGALGCSSDRCSIDLSMCRT